MFVPSAEAHVTFSRNSDSFEFDVIERCMYKDSKCEPLIKDLG